RLHSILRAKISSQHSWVQQDSEQLLPPAQATWSNRAPCYASQASHTRQPPPCGTSIASRARRRCRFRRINKKRARFFETEEEMVPLRGFEPPTPALRMRCSTPELQRRAGRALL